MRWLAERLDRVRGRSGESGVMLVLVGVSMVALLGAVAMTVDVGRIYQERRELQNGADAAAIAIAYDCAAGNCGASQSTANEYADANASDGLAGVEFVGIDSGAQKVTVRTVTDDSVGGSTFPMTFAQIVGFDGVAVKAEATVEWDGLKAGPVLPVLFRESLWDYVNPGRLSTLEEVMSGAAPPDRLVTVVHRSERHEADPASAVFEWLVDSVGCSVDVEVGALVEHRSQFDGTAPPTDCQGAGLNDVLNRVVLVPFFNGNLEGNSTDKRVTGIGGLYVKSIDECDHDGYNCITGYFISNFVVDGPLGGNDFGVSAVRFVTE